MTPWTFGFEEKIDYSGAAAGSSCYEWLGDRGQLGYGQITRKCKTKRTRRAAHIVAFEAAYGAIPEGLKVCHSCDNPGCVRLEHLFLGTQADNIRDCIAKQRFKFPEPRSGERHGMAKVSDSDAEIIRREYRKGVPYYPGNARELAARFGIGTVQVYAIANGQSRRLRTWRHTGGLSLMRSLGVACVLSLLAIGCAGPNPAFVRAMDATQRVVGKEYLAYLASDPALSDLEKATRARTILLWRATIDEALGVRQEAPK